MFEPAKLVRKEGHKGLRGIKITNENVYDVCGWLASALVAFTVDQAGQITITSPSGGELKAGPGAYIVINEDEQVRVWTETQFDKRYEMRSL